MAKQQIMESNGCGWVGQSSNWPVDGDDDESQVTHTQALRHKSLKLPDLVPIEL